MIGKPELEAFIAVARSGNFTQAAKELHLSQPALSRRIALAEERLGALLIERRRSRAIVSDVGRALLPHAEAALASLKDGLLAVRSVSRGTAGEVTLAFTNQLAETKLMDALHGFRRNYPKVELSLRWGTSPEVSDMVRRGDATLGLRYRSDPHDHLTSKEIGFETMAVVCPHGHRLLGLAEVEPDMLVDETWIAQSGVPQVPDGDLLQVLSVYGLRGRKVMPILDRLTQLSLIEAGFGIGLMTTGSVWREVEAGRVFVLNVPKMRSRVPISLITRRGSYLSEPVQHLHQTLEQLFMSAEIDAATVAMRPNPAYLHL